jgi:hypothetical protein
MLASLWWEIPVAIFLSGIALAVLIAGGLLFFAWVKKDDGDSH